MGWQWYPNAKDLSMGVMHDQTDCDDTCNGDWCLCTCHFVPVTIRDFPITGINDWEKVLLQYQLYAGRWRLTVRIFRSAIPTTALALVMWLLVRRYWRRNNAES